VILPAAVKDPDPFEEALDAEIYYRGIEAGRPLILTPKEKSELIAFLNSLTSPAAMQ
jgi:cytochrome c peroxidase